MEGYGKKCPTMGKTKVIQMKTIDIHIHGIGGYDTRTTNENHILKVAEILGSHRVSEIILTIYPSSIKEMRKNMMAVRKAIEKQKEISNPPSPPFSKGGKGGITHPSRIVGIHLEGPFLNPSKCGALDAKTFIAPSEKILRKLLEGFEDIVKIITIAPELKGAVQLIKKISDMGIIVSMGHSEATFTEAEAGFHAGAKGMTHIFNAMRDFHHREPGIAGFGLVNQNIYIEVIADPFHIHPKTLELVFKTKNPKKIIIVSDSVKETPSPIPLPSREGVKSIGISDKRGTLQGGSMTIVESSKRLVQMGFDERIIMNCITKNPAKYLSV
jgi:N-acetylglucosamine-6-phosphate deacetylase